MNLAVVGTGYVGLVAGTCFAETGNDVICVDIDERKIAMLKEGKVPIYEPGLEEMVQRNAEEQRLSFTTELNSAVKRSAIVFIAVGTPQGANGKANLEYVRATAKEIARVMDSRKIIVTKSTVPVGTADQIKRWISEETSHPFAVISNPEFLKEGAAIDDFMKPDRVVLGGDDAEAMESVKELYEPFVRTGNPILVMDSRSAEMSKYAANAMLATKISFINEVSRLCEKTGADISEVRRAIGLDPRTDDMRDAPSITVIEELLKAGARVQAFDPEATEEARKVFGDRIHYTDRNYDALAGASALLILTEWNEFRRPDFRRIKQLLKNPVIFDGRNIYDSADLQKVGFKYYSIGRNHG